MAALAAVLLPVAIVRRCAHREHTAAPDPPPRRPPPPPPSTDLAEVFGALCRHQVGCGTGDLTRCAYIVDTMRKMPKTYSPRPCDRFDEAEARRCIAGIASRNCLDATTSLDMLALQTALDRVESCRLICAATASSP